MVSVGITPYFVPFLHCTILALEIVSLFNANWHHFLCGFTGLAGVYLVNIVLAVLSVFAASERGQPVPLWVTKTLSVGGLAYDQLTQLPTLEQIEKAKAVKGKRALKNRRK